MTPRAGLSMGELSATQRAAAMSLLSSTLSKRGFEKIQQIVEADEVLKTNERNNPMFGKDLYYISILGTPSATAPWMLQFGGHHLALNVTIAGAAGVLTPSLTGAQPALYTVNGKTVRPLGQESDKGLDQSGGCESPFERTGRSGRRGGFCRHHSARQAGCAPYSRGEAAQTDRSSRASVTHRDHAYAA
jgi:hypothetical protein